MRYLYAAAALLLCAAPVSAQSNAITRQQLPAQLTLEEAIAIALRNNIPYLQQLNNPPLSESNKLLAFSRFLPVPSAQITTGGGPSRNTSPAGTTSSSNSSTNLSAGLSFNIWDRGATLTQYKQSKIQVQTSNLDVVAQEITLRAAVINQYYSAQQAERSVDLERRMLERRRDELTDQETLFRNAMIDLLDLELSQQSVKDAQNAILNAEDALTKAKLSLMETLGIAAQTTFTLSTPLPTFDVAPLLDQDSIVRMAFDGNVSIKRQELTLESSKLNAKQTKNSRIFPRITANAGFSRSIGGSGYSQLFDPDGRNTSLNGNFSFGFSFTDFIDVPAARLRNQQADASVYDANLGMRQQRMSLERQVRAAVIDLQSAYRTLAHARDAVTNARSRLESADEKLRAGTMNYINYQSIVEQASAAERALINQQLNVLTRKVALDQLLGIRPGG